MRLRPIRPTAKVARKRPAVKLNASVSRAASRREAGEFDDEEEYRDCSEPNMKLSHAFIVVLILHLIAVGGVFGFNAMKTRQATLAKIAAESGLLAPGSPAASVTAAEGGRAGQSAPRAASPTEAAALTEAPAAASAESLPKTAKTAGGNVHEVQPGDTLTRIAAAHSTTVAEIEKANHLTADAILRVGQELLIPSGGAPTSSDQASRSASAPSAASAASAAPVVSEKVGDGTGGVVASGQVYEVVAGDNPYKIAKNHKVSYQDLLALNNITDPTKLQIGQKLKIPEVR